MGTLIAVYRGLIDDIFHRRRLDRIERYVTDDYQVDDVFRPERGHGRTGLRDHAETALSGFREVRYDVTDAVEVGHRLATRYVVTARDPAGRRVAATGLSLHHARAGRLARSWHVGDQRDLGVYSELDVPPDTLTRWMTPADDIQIGPLGLDHRTLVARLYRELGPVDDVLDADYLPCDPFAERLGAGGTVAINRALRTGLADVTFHILDAFEDEHRLATRFAVSGRRRGEAVTLPGVSINEFEDGRIARAWIYCRYGRLATLVRGALRRAAS